VYDNTNAISTGPCVNYGNSYFVYNSSDAVIQNTPNITASTLYLNMNSDKTSLLMNSNSSNTYFLSVPPVAYGPIKGRYITVSVSLMKCFNLQNKGIIVQSNPWDKSNAAENAIFTQSSSDLCTGSPWVQLDFGREIPLTQITLLGYAVPPLYFPGGQGG
jgi:hypothetical protein